jgi:hypothetical protein
MGRKPPRMPEGILDAAEGGSPELFGFGCRVYCCESGRPVMRAQDHSVPAQVSKWPITRLFLSPPEYQPFRTSYAGESALAYLV